MIELNADNKIPPDTYPIKFTSGINRSNLNRADQTILKKIDESLDDGTYIKRLAHFFDSSPDYFDNITGILKAALQAWERLLYEKERWDIDRPTGKADYERFFGTEEGSKAQKRNEAYLVMLDFVAKRLHGRSYPVIGDLAMKKRRFTPQIINRRNKRKRAMPKGAVLSRRALLSNSDSDSESGSSEEKKVDRKVTSDEESSNLETDSDDDSILAETNSGDGSSSSDEPGSDSSDGSDALDSDFRAEDSEGSDAEERGASRPKPETSPRKVALNRSQELQNERGNMSVQPKKLTQESQARKPTPILKGKLIKAPKGKRGQPVS